MKELIEKYVGKKAFVQQISNFVVEVVIKDVKKSYGQLRFLVAPVAGKGEIWVEKLSF